ncbi:4'-phosphopantetheinyl transferase superfamily protein [Puteibacter caeruleilacunae]|nr:4'-phosphopantetheinyl transferase superfamily protein [Puteibacter caeruleilacunae]
MPLDLHQIYDTHELGVWELTESIEELLALYKFLPQEEQLWASFRSDRRKKEWLATRTLCQVILKGKYAIKNTNEGKPYIDNHQRHISISHSDTYIAVMITSAPHVGIDIENLSRPVEKVAKKFLSPEEQAFCDAENERVRTMLHWCTKEAIFKAIEEKDIHFSQQINLILDDQILKRKSFECTYTNKEGTQQILPVQYQIHKNQMMAFTFF